MKINKLLFGFGIIIMGCTTSKQTTEVTPEPPYEDEELQSLPALTVQEEAIDGDLIKEIPVYRASNKKVNDLLHTKLEVSFDWEKQHLLGKATLTLKPFFYPTNQLVLDAKGFDLRKVQLVKDGKFSDLPYTYDSLKITIDLGKTYTRNENYTIFIDYTAKPNDLEAGGSAAITSDKGLYFINPLGDDKSKMPQIWTQGETQASSCWFPTIDSPNEKTTQEIYITVKDKYKTLSNGKLISSKKNNDGTRTDYWKQDKKHSPYLFMMSVGEFKVVTDTWTRKDGSKMTVDYYVESEWEQYAKDIFGKTPKMLTAFSDMLGVEYPWDKYSQIVVRDYVSGAMENTSAVIHGDFLYRTDRELLDAHNESIIAHELFHHWFGDLVTCESWSNLPMNESFANYSQYLWDEYEHGRMEADKNAYGEMNGYKLQANQSGHHDLIWFDYDNREEMFDGHSYNKGGRILNMLRNYIGDEAFFLSLKDYLTKRMYNTGEAHDLRLSFEEITGEDLNWFFNQWFFDKGHPEVVIDQSYNNDKNRLVVTIEQKQDFEKFPLFKLPIDIDIYTNNGKERKRVWMTKSLQTFEFETSLPLLVNVDAEKVLLWDKEDNKPEEQWIYQLENAPLYLDKKEAFSELKSSKNPDAHRAIIAMLDHEFEDIKSMAISVLRKAVNDNEEIVKTKLLELTKDAVASVRYDALKALDKYFRDNLETKKAFETALEDPSYRVMGLAVKELLKDDKQKALSIAKKYENSNVGSVKNLVASVYAKAGGKDEHDFFIRAIETTGGFTVMGLMNDYKTYLYNQGDESFEKAVSTFQSVASGSGAWFIKMQGYNAMFSMEQKINNRIREVETEIENSTDAANKAQLERDLTYLKNVLIKTEKIIQETKENETDAQILEYLNQE